MTDRACRFLENEILETADGWPGRITSRTRTYLRYEGEEGRALAIHGEELAGEHLLTARVVVDAEGEHAGGVVDGEAIGAVEPHAGPLPHRVV